MRYIGIDYGTKKIGIALSEEEGRMAFPHSVVKNDDVFFSALLALVRENHAAVVLGDSRDYKGNENPVATAIKELGAALIAEGVGVHYEPEWYTSKEAERLQGRNAMTDAAAATVLLNSYLTRIKNASAH